MRTLRKATMNHCQNHHLISLMNHFLDPVEVHRRHCERVPAVVIEQREPDIFGRRGQMALCNKCLAVITAHVSDRFFVTRSIPEEVQMRQHARRDRARRHLTRGQAKAERSGAALVAATGPDLRPSGGYVASPLNPPRSLPPRPPAADLDHLDDYAKMRDD